MVRERTAHIMLQATHCRAIQRHYPPRGNVYHIRRSDWRRVNPPINWQHVGMGVAVSSTVSTLIVLAIHFARMVH